MTHRYYAGFLEQPFGVRIDQVTKNQTKEAKDEKDPRNPEEKGYHKRGGIARGI
jgi:hypothetical protein